jgi:D-alanine-D-alanine ligase
MWELNVIAAVVVGGTSLFGGRGSIPGTLVGALIIGVLNNSLNLLHVQHFWQKVVLGTVILLAALLDSAMHKERAKEVMRAAGIPVPGGRVVSVREAAQAHVLPRPYVLKPVSEGSSVGVFIVREDHEHPPQQLNDPGWDLGDLLAEPFIPGREMTCAVMGDRALGVTEIVPAEALGFYNYEAKYAEGGSRHIVPAPVSSNVYQLVQKLALTAHKALGCRGVSRADFRFDDTPGGTGEVVCLEVNTQPGMTATSLVPELAVHAGLSFPELVSWIVEDASCAR